MDNDGGFGLIAFDLNIEEVLDNWEVYHAIREVISNSLDEQVFSSSKEIEIFENFEEGGWHIRDYGRGIKIDHFTLNENPEKTANVSGIIGKFGVGLKDAIATFYRNDIIPTIKSKYGTYTVEMQLKGVDEIMTLHIIYDPTPNEMVGTDFYLKGVNEEDITKAKSLFLKFQDCQIIEDTKYGEIIDLADDSPAHIFINGVLVNEEDNFLYSYNITKLTPKMRKALNRERTNVGRSTYTERVKSILKIATNNRVLADLAEQARRRSVGNQCDEIGWAEINDLAINALSSCEENAIFITQSEILNNPDYIGDMGLLGYNVYTINDNTSSRIKGSGAFTFSDFHKAQQDSHEFDFVDLEDLTGKEKKVFKKAKDVLMFVGWSDETLPSIRISNTLNREIDQSSGGLVTLEAVGLYSPLMGIVILRSQLQSLVSFAGTLLHEAAHASSGATDATRKFEQELTSYLGRIAEVAVNGA